MLDHLLTLSEIPFKPDIDADSSRPFVSSESLTAAQQLDAKSHTANLFADLGVVDDDELTQERARRESTAAFTAITAADEKTKLKAVTALSLPESVRQSVAMLTQYQWDFVEQANELRSMAVSKIVKETDHHDARVRLRALELLGKVTEVALFTERVDVKHTDVDPAKLEDAIREKLQKFALRLAPQDVEVEDATLLENTQSEGEINGDRASNRDDESGSAGSSQGLEREEHVHSDSEPR